MQDILTPLADVLGRCREAGAAWEPVYDEFVAGLRSAGVGDLAPAVGDIVEDFALPSTSGAIVALSTLVADGPLVLSFNRGGWCPYCRNELIAWAKAEPALAAIGGRFTAIVGEVSGRAAALKAEIAMGADLLCDVDHGAALSLGLAFSAGPKLRDLYLSRGLDLAEAYGTDSWFLPVPATFVIDRERRVRFAFVDPDFRNRAEPAAVIAAVAGL